jgi:hypothetical protein
MQLHLKGSSVLHVLEVAKPTLKVWYSKEDAAAAEYWGQIMGARKTFSALYKAGDITFSANENMVVFHPYGFKIDFSKITEAPAMTAEMPVRLSSSWKRQPAVLIVHDVPQDKAESIAHHFATVASESVDMKTFNETRSWGDIPWLLEN